jgi:hypothetical protein
MLILGLLLLACTAAFTALAISDNLSGGPDYNVTVLGHHIATMNSLAIFCAGLALALIFGLGFLMATTGGALHRRRTRKVRAARREAATTARERDELAARLSADEPGPDYAAPAPGAPDYAYRRDDMAANRGAADPAPPQPAPGERQPAPPAGHRRHARHLFGH